MASEQEKPDEGRGATALPVRPLTLQNIASAIHRDHAEIIAAYVEGAGYDHPTWVLAFPYGALLVAVDAQGQPVNLSDAPSPGPDEEKNEGA